MIRIVNTGAAATVVDAVYVGAEAGSSYSTPNFTVTGSGLNVTIAPGAFKLFTFNFTPSTTGISFGYLQASVGGIFDSDDDCCREWHGSADYFVLQQFGCSSVQRRHPSAEQRESHHFPEYADDQYDTDSFHLDKRQQFGD